MTNLRNSHVGLLPTILAITATATSVNSLVLPSLTEIIDGVGASQDQAGLIASTATLPGILLAPVLGMLSDRFGRREVIVPCLIIFGIGGGMAGLASSMAELVTWRLIQGIGVAGLINLAVTLIGDNWSGEQRAKVIGRNVAMLMAGVFFFPILGGLLADQFGWRTPFAVFPLSLVTAIIAARILPRSKRRKIDLRQQLRDLVPALHQPYVVRALLATAVLFLIVFGIFLTMVPIYLAEDFGVSPTARGVILSAPALPNMAAALSAGSFGISPRSSMTIGALLLISALTLIATGPSVLFVVIGMLLFGGGEGMIMPNIHYITTGVESSSRGSVVALYTSAKGTGQTVGPSLGSSAFAAFGAPLTAWTAIGIGIIVLLPLLSLPAARNRRQAF